MIDREYIINQTQQYDVITFDVFDTLIIRDVRIPTDIFSLSYGIIGRYIRVAAEIVARRKSKTGEVTLDDISKVCPFSCKKELEFEKKYCRANPVMLDVYKELLQMGKKIYAISDMYLSSDFISSLLNSSGFDIPVLVSCEEHCSKKDGTLFKRFMEINSISPEKMIHIGDNYESDGEGAKKAGIKSLIIEKHSDMLSYTDYSISDPELSSFINHGLNELSDPMEKIGYEVVGPIILSFCQWIHKKKNEYRFDRLYFLARDMRFTFETYKSLYPCDESRYLCVSRKSLIKAKEKPGEFCEYLNKQGCCGNVSIVDTGWVGGMQLTIEKYACKLDENTDLGGLYLGAKLAFRNLKRSKRSAVCLYPSWMGQFKCQLFPPFMETLIGCNEKQVVDYAYGNPIFDRDESMDYTGKIKNGASKFINDWSVYKNNKSLNLKSSIKPFEKLFYYPRKEDILLLGDLHYEDNNDTKIISYDENCSYFLRPRKFMSDLSDSGWKGGFFKKCGLLYPFLLIAYTTIGAFRLYYLDHKKLSSIDMKRDI